MVIMNIRLDNILLFRDFDLNLSYPKKIVGSSIEDEHLQDRPNFRYRKLVVLMGANATGKTALGKALIMILNFISKKEAGLLFGLVDNRLQPASFSIEFAFPDYHLYRISAWIKAKENFNDEYSGADLSVEIKQIYIRKQDSYETCVARLNMSMPVSAEHYVDLLESVPPMSWLFEYPFASEGKQRAVRPAAPHIYASVLKKTLQTLDPRITDVLEVPAFENTYSIVYPNSSIMIQDGMISQPEKLSSGTNEGIGVALLITSIKIRANEFFFCDEKFSHIHSDMEKAFLSLMIQLLAPDQQLFFTTHNPDILDMDLPLHSFAFLRRDHLEQNKISCVYASDFIKKETISLRNAVENDLFCSSPATSAVFSLAENSRRKIG